MNEIKGENRRATARKRVAEKARLTLASTSKNVVEQAWTLKSAIPSL